jgi:hypothetical protein
MAPDWSFIRARRLAAVLLLALASVLAVAPVAAEVPRLTRGINFELWQHWTNRGEFTAPDWDRANFPDWSKTVDDAALAALRRQGFDFVRLNVDPSPFLWLPAETEPLLDAVEAAVRRLRAADFAVVIDLHLVPDMPDRPLGLHTVLGTGGIAPSEIFDRYLALVTAFATRFRDAPASSVALELMNEPDQDWYSHATFFDRWPEQLDRLHAAARKAAPKLPLVLTGARGGSLAGLERVDARRWAGDDAVLWSFHYYEPYVVTHAGQPWDAGAGRFLTRVPFPADRVDPTRARALLADAGRRLRAEIADPARRAAREREIAEKLDDYVASGAGPATIDRDFQKARAWASANGVPPSRILVGEFGVFQDGADPAARIAVIRETRRAAEAQGFAWAIYTAGLTRARASFGILDDTRTMRVEEPIAAALGLDRPAR